MTRPVLQASGDRPAAASIGTVSVVIPTRGRPDRVVRAVQSALRQTVPPLEVIVVIDGPDHVTRARLDSLADQRVRVVETPAVGGSSARNLGVREARGQWIGLLDDDDEWLPSKLERQLALAVTSQVPYPILACRVVARSDRSFVWPTRLPFPGEDLSEYLFVRRSPFQGEAVVQSSMLVAPRTLFERVPFAGGLPRHQDWDWLLRATKLEGTALLFAPEALAVWHIEQAGGSLSTGPGWSESAAWIRSVQDRVTPRAYSAFLLTVAAARARQDGDWSAFGLLARQALEGKPLPSDWLLYLGMWLVPRRVRRWVRGVARGSRVPNPAHTGPDARTGWPSGESSLDVGPDAAALPGSGRGQVVGRLASIIIPCHNGKAYLGAAIESALRQTYARTEVIVVDDGSTDGSARVAEAFGDRVRLVRQPNRGLSAARNAGVEASCGEYLVLLDADDLLAPTCVASRIAALEGDPGAGLVAGHYREIDEGGRVLPRVPELRRVGRVPPDRQAVRRNWGPPVGWTFRREAYDRCGGFDPGLCSCEDWDFVIRVARQYRIAYVPTAETFYRRHGGSMSRNHSVMLLEMAKVQRKNRSRGGWRYWLDCQLGRFELGRRILYDSLFGGPSLGLGRTMALVRRHPSLIWIGILSAASLVLGKRAGSASPAEDWIALARARA